MSAMANITPIVTTVTKTATKEKTPNGAEAASRVNILDFCEEHYEDIFPVMDKIRRDKRKEFHTRLDFGENSRKRNTLEMVPTVEVVLTNETLLLEDTILEEETAPMASKNRMVIHTPLTEYGTNIGTARVWFDELPLESIEGYKDLKAAFLAYFMQQKIFMHWVNNPELTKRLNEHVPKTVEEMIIAIDAFIRGETVVASKKKVYTPWKSQDQSKRQNSERRSDFKNQPRDGRGSNKFTPFTRTPKEIFAAESGKFKPLPPMLRKQIEELVRAGKLSHFIKEVRRTIMAENDAVEAEISGHVVHHIYVNEGSSMEVLYEHCFNRFQLEIKSQMVPATMSLTDFSRETIWPLEQLRLLVTIGDAEHYTKAWMNFMIVRSPSPYNSIIIRHEIREIQAVLSMAHGMIKFPVNGGIVTIRTTILTPTECTTIAVTPKDHAKKAEARHKFFKLAIHPDFPDQEIAIGGTVSIKARTELCTLLKRNLDIFAWQPSDMTRVPRSIAEHRLNIRERYPSVRQKKRRQALERAKAIQVEVQKLVEAGILREVYYHDWLSNPVMVKKHDGSWRMSNPYAATPLSVSWTPTKAILKYRWLSKMRKGRLSTPVTKYIATQKCHSASKTLAPHTSDCQEVTQILPGASHHGHHRLAHQASDVMSRHDRTIAKIERN
nr:reverse transcriptase domain-containing protein [Tanacetum cinerariifolium]